MNRMFFPLNACFGISFLEHCYGNAVNTQRVSESAFANSKRRQGESVGTSCNSSLLNSLTESTLYTSRSLLLIASSIWSSGFNVRITASNCLLHGIATHLQTSVPCSHSGPRGFHSPFCKEPLPRLKFSPPGRLSAVGNGKFATTVGTCGWLR